MNEALSGISLAIVIVGISLSSFITRTSFLLAGSRLRLSHRVEMALRFAPVCTLAAIIAPDVLMHGPQAALDLSPMNPRLIGALAGALWLCWSRNILGCLALGMAAYTVARVYL
jgi:branched-subunit amino acid transport protein